MLIKNFYKNLNIDYFLIIKKKRNNIFITLIDINGNIFYKCSGSILYIKDSLYHAYFTIGEKIGKQNIFDILKKKKIILFFKNYLKKTYKRAFYNGLIYNKINSFFNNNIILNDYLQKVSIAHNGSKKTKKRRL
jgi:hypothetical protein